MSKEMQERIVRKCYVEMEEEIMNTNITKKTTRKSMVAVAALALCFCLTGVTALAATGKLQGFFKDITDWSGAVTGTTYEQATDEIEMSIGQVSDMLTIEFTMVDPNVAPYVFFEAFGVESYKIVAQDGKVLVEGEKTEMVEINDGKINLSISVGSLASGEYKLVVSKLVGSSKADQPLVISGKWECEFVK